MQDVEFVHVRILEVSPGASMMKADSIHTVDTVDVERVEVPQDDAVAKFNIMRLHMILSYVVDPQALRVFLKNSKIGIQRPELAHAGDKKLRLECLLVALNMCTVEIHSGPGNAKLQNWLSKIAFAGIETFLKTGFDAIHSLNFPYFSRFPYGAPGITKNNDVGLALACQNLRTLCLNFHPDGLGRCMSDHVREVDYKTRSAASIRANYQLDGLLDAKKLEVLRASLLGPRFTTWVASERWRSGSGRASRSVVARWRWRSLGLRPKCDYFE